MMFSRRKSTSELYRQSSEESSSSTAAPSKPKAHRRMPSFTFSSGLDGISSAASVKSPTTSATDHYHVWSSGGTTENYWPDRKNRSDHRGHRGGKERNDSSLELEEIIRQLSFSPPRSIRKKNDTTSSPSPTSCASFQENGGCPNLDVPHLEDLRKCPRSRSPSPLLGLQYLPDESMFMKL